MKSVGEVNTLDPVELFNIGLQVFTNPLIWLGILLLGLFFGLYLAALSWADLSFVLPVTSFGYAMNVHVVAIARRTRLDHAVGRDDNHLRGRGHRLPHRAKNHQPRAGRRRFMKTFLLLCSLVVGSSLGEILSAKGMRKVGDVSFRPRALIGALGRMFRSPYLFGGVACLAVAFFSFISLLSYADLSFVAPLTAVIIHHQHPGRAILSESESRNRGG